VPRHLLFCLDWAPKIGGAHHWMQEVYRRWPSSVVAVTAAGEGGTSAVGAERIDSLEVFRVATAVTSIDVSLDCVRTFVGNARELVRRLGHDEAVVHCKATFPEGICALIAKRMRRASTHVVVYVHGEELLIAGSSRLIAMLARWVLRGADTVIANSRNTASMIDAFLPGRRVHVVHPGVDVAAHRVGPLVRDAMRARLGAGDAFVVITVGRLEARKNHRTVLGAIARLRGEGRDVRYWCVGEGETRASLVALVAANGWGDWVRLTGRVDDEERRRLVAAADLHAMPSIDEGGLIEGFGIVFLEAAAAGVPSIAGNSGGQAEAVLDGRTGRVVDGRNVEAVADAIRGLMADPKARDEMALRCVAWAAENDWARVVARTLGALQADRGVT